MKLLSSTSLVFSSSARRNLLMATFVASSMAAVFQVQAESSVAIDVQLNPVGNFTAHAESVSGEATKKGEEVIAKNIVLKIDDLKSGVELRDDHMNKEYFESEKFPEAKIVAAKGKGGKFIANLIVHGEKQKISGTYEISGSTLKAKFKTQLSLFKIKKASYMGVGVVDDVNVAVSIPVK